MSTHTDLIPRMGTDRVRRILVSFPKPPPEPVGPCGCTACEDWSDCDYCDYCSP